MCIRDSLILDEPTSSLDPETESLLEESTRRLMRERTVITIAHRLNTIFRSDQIILLEEGQIIERGTHRELLDRNGTYAAMVKTYEISSEQMESERLYPQFGDHPTVINNYELPPVNSPFETLVPYTAVVKQESSILLRLLSFLSGSWNWVALSILLSTL